MGAKFKKPRKTWTKEEIATLQEYSSLNKTTIRKLKKVLDRTELSIRTKHCLLKKNPATKPVKATKQLVLPVRSTNESNITISIKNRTITLTF